MFQTVLIIVVGAFLFGVVFGAFLTLVAGIHAGDRRRNLTGQSGSATESASRRALLSVRCGSNDDNDSEGR